MSEQNDELTPRWVVYVQRATEDFEIDSYVLDPGEEPVVESLHAELIVNKEGEDGGERFVAIYGQGMWVCAWVDPYAEDDEDGDG